MRNRINLSIDLSRKEAFHNAFSRFCMTFTVSMLLLTILFQKTIEAVLFAGETTMVDEVAIFILVGLAVLIQLNRKALKKHFIVLLCIATYLILISFIFGVSRSVFQVVIQSFLHLQLFIILLSVYVIYEHYPGFIKKVFLFAAIISTLGAFVQLLIPSLYSTVFGAPVIKTATQKIFLRIEGVQKNPNALGVFFAFLVVLLIHKKQLIKSSKIRLVTITGSVLIIVLTGSRSSMLFVVLGVLFSDFRLSKKVSMAIVALLILAGTGMLENLQKKTAKNIEGVVFQSVDETRYTRWLMTYYGTEIAINNFPIGTGAATFGTALSKKSPVYDDMGIGGIPSLYEGRGINDSNYGAIAGEFGVIGLLIFYGIGAYFISCIFKKCFSYKAEYPSYRSFLWSIFCISLLATFFRPLFLGSYYSTILVLTLFSYIEGEQIICKK